MILVDTSIWIDHLRAEDPHWTSLLADGEVLVHPMVIGELACGNLRHREQVIMDLQDLPASPVETNDEALLFLNRYQLMGRGIGFIDITCWRRRHWRVPPSCGPQTGAC